MLTATSVALAATIGVVFAPVRGFGFQTWDDLRYIVNNPYVVSGLAGDNIAWAFTMFTPYFHPVTWISHMIDVELFGLWPGGHHLTAVALHSVSAVLLFLLLVRLTGAPARSAVVAFLFAVHPMRVESVAWIAERKDLLPVLFMMLALHAYVSYARRPSAWRYALVALPFVLGLMSKPILITLPFVLLLLDFWPLERLQWSRSSLVRLALEKTPLACLSLAAVVWNLTMQQQALTPLGTIPLDVRLTNALIHYSQYIAMTVWPSGLSPLHPVSPTLAPWWTIAGAGALLVAISSIVFFARERRYPVAGWLWFLATLVPVIGLLQAGDQGMADRFGYISTIGLYLVVVWGVADAAARWRAARLLMPVAAVAVIAVLATGTRQYLWHWQDSVGLWRRAVSVHPDSHRTHANLADALVTEGRVAEAIDEFEAAMRLAPQIPEYPRYLGMALARLGRLDEAVAAFERSLRLNPYDAATRDDLGVELARAGRVDDAIRHHREALRLNPRSARALGNLGVALARKGEATAAMAAYNESLGLDSAQPQFRTNRGALLLAQGETREALKEFEEARRLDPFTPDRHVAVGVALSRQGNRAFALEAFARALTLDPTHAEAHNAIGVMQLADGQAQEAIASFTAAIASRPDQPHYYSNRARARVQMGQIDAAQLDYEHVLRLDPGNVGARQALETLRQLRPPQF